MLCVAVTKQHTQRSTTEDAAGEYVILHVRDSVLRQYNSMLFRMSRCRYYRAKYDRVVLHTAQRSVNTHTQKIPLGTTESKKAKWKEEGRRSKRDQMIGGFA